MGYHRAGFDVIGVDITEQPNYPYDFVQGDALQWLNSGIPSAITAIHASPPCQFYANVTAWRGEPDNHANLIPATRQALENTGRPWVIENVPEAPLRPDYLLCGSMFGLNIKRHRAFETSWHAHQFTSPCSHHRDLLPFMHKGERAYADALGCYWMTSREAREAVPPVYTEYIGAQLLTTPKDAA